MNKKLFVPFFLIAMLLLAACSEAPLVSASDLPVSTNTQPAATATATSTAPVTAPAELSVTLPTLLPTATANSTATLPPTPTGIPTLVPTIQPTPTLAPTIVSAPCNLAWFVGDVTIPDGSLFNTGNTFTKTWRLQNVGTCSWTTGYALVFTTGDLMSGPTVVPFPYNVNPYGTIDLSVNLAAPASAGVYQGNWMLRDPNGNLFGVGSNGSQPFWVKIVVSSPAFAVMQVSQPLNPTNYVGNCPVTYMLDAIISTNGVGTVTYHWLRSDGSVSPETALYYTAAGYQTASDTWTSGVAGSVINVWDQLYIDKPNAQTYSPTSFSLTCELPTPTQTQAPTQLPTPTLTQTSVPTNTPTAVPTQTQTPTPTQPASTNTATPAPTQTPTSTLPAPTNTPTPVPTQTQTPTTTQPVPTHTPTTVPTQTPTQPSPTNTPTSTSPAPTQTTSPTPTPTKGP